MTPTMNDLQRALVLLLVLGVFAYIGYRRGFWGELLKLVMLIVGYAISQTDLLGGWVIRIINVTYFLIRFTLGGGLGALFAEGGPSAERLVSAFEAVGARGPLIRAGQGEALLFVLMLGLLILAFVVAGRVKRKASKIAGLLMGAVNGLVIAYIFRPYLSGTPLFPPMPETAGTFEIVRTILGTALDVLVTPVRWLGTAVGLWIVPVLIVLVVLFLLRSLRG
ncbi:MAG: hypothetical protein RMN24_02035 [Anaerolineae bacterium]|nr:hypothetical protein [Caldilineales bacterium]MDW8267921.1 hypothetical protein [Anaerolineae bacterium]